MTHSKERAMRVRRCSVSVTREGHKTLRNHNRAGARVLAVLAGFVASVVAMPPLPAAQAEGTPSAESLSKAADSIYSIGRDLGFAGQVLAESSGHIDLYWQGAIPRNVAEYVAALAPTGITVTIHADRPLSRLAEQAAGDALNESALPETIGAATISAKSDGTGLTVAVTGAIPSLAQQQAVAATAGLLPTEVSYVPDSGLPVDTAATRVADTAPWHSGSRYYVKDGTSTYACTLGFSVLSGGYGYLLSANHCDPHRDPLKTPGGTQIAPGNGVTGNANIDSILINPTASPATQPHVFTGGWNSSTTATVKNWASNWKGQTICDDGSTSGERCGTITNDATTLPGRTGSWYVEAHSDAAGGIAAEGDSGGPVFTHVTGGVQARGIELAAKTPVPCGAVNPDAPPSCFSTFFYEPISVALNTWNVTLKWGES